jgi:hypothetical protein
LHFAPNDGSVSPRAPPRAPPRLKKAQDYRTFLILADFCFRNAFLTLIIFDLPPKDIAMKLSFAALTSTLLVSSTFFVNVVKADTCKPEAPVFSDTVAMKVELQHGCDG